MGASMASIRNARLIPIEIGGGVAASRPDQVYAWPGMTIVKDGELLAVASERKFHICPFGRIVIVRSLNGGVTWDIPQEIYNSELDDRHPSLVTMPDGTIICSFFTVNFWMTPAHITEDWKPRAARVTDRLLEEVLGDWLIRSFDGGNTWEGTPHRMPDGGSLHASPCVFESGVLGCFGYEREHGSVKLYFYTSLDKGVSWERKGEGPVTGLVTGTFAWMPWQLARGAETITTPLTMRSILELGDGSLLAVFGGAGGLLFQSSSKDGGASWTSLTETQIWGFPPHLLRLREGPIMCSYGYRKEPCSVRATLSYDDGLTWDIDGTIIIDQWADNPDMGYPVAAEPMPGELAFVYYLTRKPVAPGKENKDMVPGSSPEGLLYKRFQCKL